MIRLRMALAERYAVQRELGQGGSAVVYLAQDLRHSRPVAIKVLRPELAAIMGAERFLREIETVARLQHPHILPLYDSGEAQGLLYFVMPFVSGESLRDLLERDRQLPVARAIAIVRDVAAALAYAHNEGVIHRDIKPENILLFGGSAVVADFGIARALTVAGADRITEANLVPGTPLYMSPEQTAGTDLDGRSDIYSLGIVLYEMLGGEAPFTGFSPVEVMVHQLKDPPRPLTELRASLPSALIAAVERSLAKNPADRFATVTAFAEALQGPLPAPPQLKIPFPRRAALRLAALIVMLAVSASLLSRLVRPRLDRSAWLIAPFEHGDSNAAAMISGDRCLRRMRAALERWQGLRVVDPLVTASLVAQDDHPADFAGALAEARTLRAGMLVFGRVWLERDSLHVRAGLYDVGRGGRELAASEITAASDGADLDARFGDLADSLVVGRGHSVTAKAGLWSTHSVAAKDAWLAADSALGQWDLAEAESGFRQALRIDPSFGYAALRAAQVMQWRGAPSADYGDLAASALAAAAGFAPADSLHAAALAAMVSGEFVAACEDYRRLTQRNGLDVLAWYGLADCLYHDRVVVRDPRTRSGWRFRSSYDEGIRALGRAVAVAPSVHVAFQGGAWYRLAQRLYVESNDIRAGMSAGPDSVRFGAYVELAGDSLVFVPFPLAALLAGAPATWTSATATAVQRNRDSLLAITRRWQTQFPRSPVAWESYARALEGARTIGSGAAREVSALSAVRRAKALTTDPRAITRLAITEVRLALKAGQWTEAARLADAVLAVPPADGAGDAILAPLAALRGRLRDAARMASADDTVYLPTGEPIAVPPEVLRAGRRLQVYAAFGEPADSLVPGAGTLRRIIAAVVPKPDQERVFWALFNLPATIAHGALRDVIATGEPGGNDLLGLWRRLDAGDAGGVRQRLRALSARREGIRMLPGEVEILATFMEAQLALAAGDTAWGTSRLAASYEAPGSWSPYVIAEPFGAAALVRGMILRADLAHRSGDDSTAGRWAAAATTLWDRTPDPDLRPVLARMRHIAGR